MSASASALDAHGTTRERMGREQRTRFTRSEMSAGRRAALFDQLRKAFARFLLARCLWQPCRSASPTTRPFACSDWRHHTVRACTSSLSAYTYMSRRSIGRGTAAACPSIVVGDALGHSPCATSSLTAMSVESLMRARGKIQSRSGCAPGFQRTASVRQAPQGGWTRAESRCASQIARRGLAAAGRPGEEEARGQRAAPDLFRQSRTAPDDR